MKAKSTKSISNGSLCAAKLAALGVTIILLCDSTPAGATMWQVANFATLRTGSFTNLANNDLAILPGYSTPDDRGGGWFIWQTNSSAADDGGRYATNAYASGRWVRILKGETANVKMWGATGNGSTDDTAAIQNGVNACAYNNWTTELMFPVGTYSISNTILFYSSVHLRGESPNPSGSIISMKYDKDVLRTMNTQQALTNQNYLDFDHWLLIENLKIVSPTNAVTNACIVVTLPGEASVIRNVLINNGGYGIRSFGPGAPGLRVLHSTINDMYVANISVEGYLPTGRWVGGSGTVSLLGVSGDHNRADSDTRANFLLITNCYATVSVYDFKAEGKYGGGVFLYDRYLGANNTGGSLVIHGGTENFSNTNFDFVVLKSSDAVTASVTIDNVFISGSGTWRYLIRDDLTGRTVAPDELYTHGRLPLHYESVSATPKRSRLVVGDTALYSFVPPQITNWYRVMVDLANRLGGTLSISSINDTAEFSAEVLPGATGDGAQINVIRTTKDVSSIGKRPLVTQARAGSWLDPNLGGPGVGGYQSFVDIWVERAISSGYDYDKRIHLAHPIEGRVLNGYDGRIQLLTPTSAITYTNIAPDGCTLVNCVTNSLIR